MKKVKGLGDLIEIVTKYTGIKWIWNKLYPDCGCEGRREKLNVKIPFE